MNDRENAIIRTFETKIALAENREQHEIWITLDVMREILDLLKEQKHGYWVFDPNGMDWNLSAWKCSKCHCRNDNIPPNLEKTNPLRWAGSKFCPNCGAKMDEEVKQNG